MPLDLTTLFESLREKLLIAAFRIVHDRDEAEDIVQDALLAVLKNSEREIRFSPRKLQEALAHSDANLTKRYTHLNSEAMKEVGLRIGRILKIERISHVREGYDERVG